jgi:16S rRNA (uracil1498-N3)-methyltransferase
VTPPLFLLPQLPEGDRIVLDGDEGRHAVTVRRLGAGEQLLVGDGRGTVLACIAAEVTPGRVVLQVVERRHEPAPSPRLVVVQALPKGDRGELAVEVMTELGVDEIVPWAATRCITQWRDARGTKALDRWSRTAREAAKQSRRARVPKVSPLVSTAQLVQRIAGSGAVVLHEAAKDPLASVELPAAGDLLIVVGPEGGITEDELGALTGAGAASVRLGTPVLRTSTAGAAALAALSLRLGRWA